MHAQILEVTLGDQCTHRVGQRANPELDGGAVFQQLHHIVGDALVCIAGLGFRQLHQGGVRAFDHHVHLGNMNAFIASAEATRYAGIHLHHDLARLAQIIRRHGTAGGKVEKAIRIHGSHLGNCHCRRFIEAHGLRALMVGEWNITGQAFFGAFARQTGKVPVIPDERFPGRISFHTLQGLDAGGRDQNHVAQLVLAQGQCCIERLDVLHKLPHENLVSRLHQRSSCFGRHLFFLIQAIYVHSHRQHSFLSLKKFYHCQQGYSMNRASQCPFRTPCIALPVEKGVLA